MSLGSFLKNVSGFKLLEGKNILKDIGKNPSRLLTGVDPFSTKVWNKVLGTDNKPIVDQMGGATAERSDQARAAGIDPKNGEAVEKVAHVVAAAYAAGGLMGAGSGSAGTTVGGTSGGTTSISALTPAEAWTGGLTASNAAVAGITPGAISSAGGALGVAGGTTAAGTASGGLGSSTSYLTEAQMQTAMSNAPVAGTNTLADASAGGAFADGTAVGSSTPGLTMGNAFDTAGMVNAGSQTDYTQQQSSDSKKKRSRPYEDINNNGGMNSVSEDLFSRYNKNEGNFNDGNKIVIKDGMAVLIDGDGNEIGSRPNDGNLHSMLRSVERG